MTSDRTTTTTGSSPTANYESYDRAVPEGVEEISVPERRRRHEEAQAGMLEFFGETAGAGLEQDGE